MASWLDQVCDIGSAASGMLRRKPCRRDTAGEAGAALVETALSAAVMFSVLIGLFEVCLAMYTFTYVSDAAREATRWAMVRGSTSCTNSSSNLPGCGATSAQIQAYVDSLQYPAMNASNLTVTVSYLVVSTSSGSAVWSACVTSPCNVPGNEVRVQVKYQLPLYIPFWRDSSVQIGSTSTMVIQQ
jgi:Flp pilus assembly protein TadG